MQTIPGVFRIINTWGSYIATDVAPDPFNYNGLSASPNGMPQPAINRQDLFLAIWTGHYFASTAGTYVFATRSDDGSMLFVDGVPVVSNNADQPATTRSGSVSLSVGYHDLFIVYGESGGGYSMQVQVQTPTAGNQVMPRSMTSAAHCVACSYFDANCATCTSSGCSTCASGYGLSNGQCVLCSTVFSNCAKCDGGVCTVGATGFFASGGLPFACTAYDTHCVTCSNSVCLTCQAGYAVSGSGAGCVACSTMTPDGQCSVCTSSACTQCNPTFYLPTSTSCLSCGTYPNCAAQCVGRNNKCVTQQE